MQSASRLWKYLSHRPDEPAQPDRAHLDLLHFVGNFDALVHRLDEPNDGTESRGSSNWGNDLARACWKVSQDILLRLGRNDPVDQQPMTNSDACVTSAGLVWTAQDVGALGDRLSELASQWGQIQLSQEYVSR
jgi:hypothetical protein